MNPLSEKSFSDWLAVYAEASEKGDPLASAELFLQNARYFETPFSEPLVGRQAIYEYWKAGAEKLKDKQSRFEILAVNGNIGIARWLGAFTVIGTGARVELDGVFVVELAEDNRCSVFREWWHRKVGDTRYLVANGDH